MQGRELWDKGKGRRSLVGNRCLFSFLLFISFHGKIAIMTNR
jgi:hypothetical protein